MRCYNIQYRVDAEQATTNDVKNCKLGMILQRDSDIVSMKNTNRKSYVVIEWRQ